MDLLVVFRVLTLTGLFANLAALVYVLTRRAAMLSPTATRAWRLWAARHLILALTTAMVEVVWVLSVLAPESSLYVLGRILYNPAYLFNGIVEAVMPVVLVSVLSVERGVRRICAAMAVAVGVVGVSGVLGGAVRDWGMLMTTSQILTFVTVIGYLAFFALLLFGRLRGADAYMIGMVAVVALYYVVLPIQTVFFQTIGRVDAPSIWHLNEILQLSMAAAELAIALAFVNALARGKDVRSRLVPA